MISSSSSRKGQYFSFDAIMASIIFILALSMLTSHWFALRAQIDASSDYLGADAVRVSDLLLGVGNPLHPTDYTYPTGFCPLNSMDFNWYLCPTQAVRAGFAVNNSPFVVLNISQLEQAQSYVGYESLPQWQSLKLDHYNAYRTLMSIGGDFKIEVNTTDIDPGTGKPKNFVFGRDPPVNARAPTVNANEIAQVRRSIVLYDNENGPGYNHYYAGNLTVYLWSSPNRS